MVRRAGKLVASAVFSGILATLAGWLVSGACFGVAIWMAMRSGAPEFQCDPGFWGFAAGVANAAVAYVWAIVLGVVALVGCVVHVVLGYKFAVQTLVFRLWSEGHERFLDPLLAGIAEHLERSLPKTLRSAVKWGALRVEMLESMRRDPSVGLVRRLAISWLLEKVRAEKIDLADKERLGASVAVAVRSVVSEIVEPSWSLSAGVVAFQIAAMGLCLWLGLA